MTKERLSRLQETARSKNKILLIESVDFSNTSYNLLENIELPKDKPILIENSMNSSPIKARGVLKNVPVTKFTKNKNGRIYSKQLWEAVGHRKSFEGGSCLADHAEKEGSTTRICGTWHNFRVNENYATADLYLIGEHGQLFLEAILSKNKNLGLSTVGFGDFLSDGITVNPDTYELSEESVCDWVLTPSQGVFATYENYVDTSNSYTESYKEYMNINNENKYTNKIENKKISNTERDIKENSVMNNEFIKLQEFNVKSHVKTALKESKKIVESKDIDAIRDNKEILISLIENIPSSDAFLEDKSKLSNQIELIESTIVSLIKDQSSALSKVSSSLKETATKHTQVLQEKINLEKKLAEATKVVQKLKENIEKEEKAFSESLGVAKNDVLLLEKEVKKRDESIRLYENSHTAMKHDIKIFIMREKEFISKLRKYSSSLRKIKEAVNKLPKKNDRKVQELTQSLIDVKKLINVYKEKATSSSAELVSIKSKYLESVKEKNQIKETAKRIEESKNSLSRKVSILEKENRSLKFKVKQLKEAHPDFAKKKGYEDYSGKLEDGYLAPEPSQELQYEVDKNKNYLNLAKENKKINVMDSVKKLYENKVRQYPSIKSIQGQILKSRSVSEAVELIEYFLSNSSISNTPIKESVNNSLNKNYYPAGSFLEGRD